MQFPKDSLWPTGLVGFLAAVLIGFGLVVSVPLLLVLGVVLGLVGAGITLSFAIDRWDAHFDAKNSLTFKALHERKNQIKELHQQYSSFYTPDSPGFIGKKAKELYAHYTEAEQVCDQALDELIQLARPASPTPFVARWSYSLYPGPLDYWRYNQAVNLLLPQVDALITVHKAQASEILAHLEKRPQQIADEVGRLNQLNQETLDIYRLLRREGLVGDSLTEAVTMAEQFDQHLSQTRQTLPSSLQILAFKDEQARLVAADKFAADTRDFIHNQSGIARQNLSDKRTLDEVADLTQAVETAWQRLNRAEADLSGLRQSLEPLQRGFSQLNIRIGQTALTLDNISQFSRQTVQIKEAMVTFEKLLGRQQAHLQTEVLATQASLKARLDALLAWASFHQEPTIQLAQEALARPLPAAKGWPSLTVQLAGKVDLLVEWEIYHQLLQTAQAELVRHVEEPLRVVLQIATKFCSLTKTRYSSLTKGWLPTSMPTALQEQFKLLSNDWTSLQSDFAILKSHGETVSGVRAELERLINRAEAFVHESDHFLEKVEYERRIARLETEQQKLTQNLNETQTALQTEQQVSVAYKTQAEATITKLQNQKAGLEFEVKQLRSQLANQTAQRSHLPGAGSASHLSDEALRSGLN